MKSHVCFDSLQAQLAACKSQLSGEDGRDKRPVYRHNHQLEELRNLQDRLTQEKQTWQREKEAEERDLEERKEQLLRLQVRKVTECWERSINWLQIGQRSHPTQLFATILNSSSASKAQSFLLLS